MAGCDFPGHGPAQDEVRMNIRMDYAHILLFAADAVDLFVGFGIVDEQHLPCLVATVLTAPIHGGEGRWCVPILAWES